MDLFTPCNFCSIQGQPHDIPTFGLDNMFIFQGNNAIIVGAHLRAFTINFCSIGGVLVSKFCGEAKTHEISKTQQLFMEIPPRDDSIKLLATF